jgi:hypothetical protein
MTEDGLTSYIEQGMLPPRSLTYTVTADTLTINPGVHDVGGLSGETAFIKVIE